MKSFAKNDGVVEIQIMDFQLIIQKIFINFF